MAAGMLAEHERGLLQPDHFGPHDFVSGSVLQHAVLVDTTLVGKRITPDDRLVVLHRKRRRGRYQFRGRGEPCGVDLVPVREYVVAYIDRHHDLFERGIARAFADAVDGAFDLTRAAGDTGERVGDCHAEVVVAVDREHGLVGVRHPLDQRANEAGVFLWHGVTDGIGNIDRGGAGLDHGFHDAAQVIHLRARAVFRRAFDVVRVGARQAGDNGVLGAPRDLAHGLEVAFRGDRETGLDDVDAHVVEHLGDLELFLEGHGGAGALLAVAQGGVEYNDAVLFGLIG